MKALALALFCVAAPPAAAQSFLGLTIKEPAPADHQPTGTRPLGRSLGGYDDVCVLSWDLIADRQIEAFADGCDGPILSLHHDNGLFSAIEAGTSAVGFTFFQTTLAQTVARFGSTGVRIGHYGNPDPARQNSLAWRIEGTNTLAVFHFIPVLTDGAYDLTPDSRNTSRLGAIGLADVAFLQAIHVDDTDIDLDSAAPIADPFPDPN